MAPRFDSDPLPGETEADRSDRLAAAARVCAGCAVQSACSTVARELGRRASGVWAGHVRGELPRIHQKTIG
ncbi:WhiB family transcriptional regulator [Nocardia sp. NRRL WC-3656]|uniref:WhiB family transcriptional regulator n=1 Tax=Nocardia sp. NRRL WC-3656 TaxID=1463824 RepID=UPI0035109B03